MPAQTSPRRHRTWVWSVALLGLLAAALLVWLLRERPVAEVPARTAAPGAVGSSGPGPRVERSTRWEQDGGRRTRSARASGRRSLRSPAASSPARTAVASRGPRSPSSRPRARPPSAPARTGASSSCPRAPVRTSSRPCSPRVTCPSARSGGRAPSGWSRPPPPGTPELVVSLEPEVRLKGRVEAPGRRSTYRRCHRRRSASRGASPGVVSSGAPLDHRCPRRVQRRGSGRGAARWPRRRGSPPRSSPSVARANTRTVTLRLKTAPADAVPEPLLAGRVVDDRGAPVPDAVVTLGVSRRPGEGGSVLPAPVTTDAQGRFRFEAVPAQVGWAQARAGDLLSDRVGVEPGADRGGAHGPPRRGARRTGGALRRPAGDRVRAPAGPAATGRAVADALGRGSRRAVGGPRARLGRLGAPGAGRGQRACPIGCRVELPASPGARVEKELRLRGGRRLPAWCGT